MCQLSVIFNQILVHMYDPMSQNTEEEVDECVRTQEAALQQWWGTLPHFLRLDATALPALAPPSHIVTLKYVLEPPISGHTKLTMTTAVYTIHSGYSCTDQY
jgi:hypothetical protein